MTMKSFAFSSFLFMASTTMSKGWSQLGSTIIPSFGSIVKLSDSGTRVAIGSPAENGSVTVYEMDQDSETWSMLAKIEGAEGEGMGDSISLSPDGNFLAVRRYHVTPSVVQVYQTNGNTVEKIGHDVRACDDEGHSVTLGQASVVPREGSSYFLFVSCESYDNDRGKVQAFQLTSDGLGADEVIWQTYLEPLEGRASGDRFGSALAVAEAPSPLFASGRVFRVAVSSPNYDRDTGLVQVFSADRDHGWSQFGGDLVGEHPGDTFGASIAMSSTEAPYIVIGSPNKGFAQGAVQLVHWRSLSFGGPSTWNNVGNRLDGAALNHRSLGTSVAISSDGGRIAASSMGVSAGSGYYVSVIDRTTFNDLHIAATEPWGGSVALNYQGSVVAVATDCVGCQEASTDGVRVLLDDSAFCSLPTKASDGVNADLNTFLTRSVCRGGALLLVDEIPCSQTMVYMNGEFTGCEWVPEFVPVTEVPSKALTSAPQVLLTMAPTITPSVAPSTIPTHWLSPHMGTQTIVPTSYVDSDTASPSSNPEILSPSSQPTEAFHSTPLSPSPAPSNIPSAENPTSGPSALDLDSPSPVPSSRPSPQLPTQLQTQTPSSTPSEYFDFTASPEIEDDVDSPEYNGFGGDVRARACQCDALGRCISEPLVDGSILNVCVDVGVSNILVGIVDCQLHHGEINIPVVQESETILPGALNGCMEGLCSIHTPVDANFFKGDGDFLIVTGTIGVVDTRKRNLRQSSRRLLSKTLQYSTVVFLSTLVENESTATGGESDEESKSGDIPPFMIWLLIAFLLLVAIILVWWYLQRRRLAKAASYADYLD